MIKIASNAHWYTKAGEPSHDSTLREARKQFLYPSVTTIDKDVFKNDFLDNWKLNQILKAAVGTFKQLHESDEDYAARLYELSRYKADTAADFGKKVHDAIENYPVYPEDTTIHPWLDRFSDWQSKNIREVIHREKVLADHDIGVAGRCDYICIGAGPFEGSIVIPDWKTQDVKIDKKQRKSPAFYESWPRQLGFYAVAYAKESNMFPDLPRCVSVIFDSNEASDPYVKQWSKEEVVDNYYDFVAGAYLWFSKRGYWPAGKWSLNPSVPMPPFNQ